jgi:Ni/Co efflux regulator RcnB
MIKILAAVAALAAISLSIPATQASAETVVIKKGDHDRDWNRHHHKKVIVVKHGHHDHY